RHGNGESTSAYKRAMVRMARHRPQEPRSEIPGPIVRAMTKRSYRFAASVGPSGDFDGDRPGVREAGESAQRVLDDLVQGRAVLLLQRRLPDEIRSEAGTLSTRGLGATRETGRLLSPRLSSLEASERFRRRHARRAEGGARGREAGT